MFRLLFLLFVGFLLFTLWRIIRFMLRPGPRPGSPHVRSSTPERPVEKFSNVKDADFEDISDKDDSPAS